MEKGDLIKTINWNHFKKNLKIETRQINNKVDIEEETTRNQTEIKMQWNKQQNLRQESKYKNSRTTSWRQ